jgi:predicted alpha/beta hydrolase
MGETFPDKSTWSLSFKSEEIAIHRFRNKKSDFAPILLIHGSIENGKIFYSKSGKGFAPYLAQQGFDVFAADLRGRGSSKPAVSRHSKTSQTDTITEEIPAIINEVMKISNASSLHLGAHSWGGVLLLSAYALYHTQLNINSMIFLGSKRRISIRNLNRFVTVDFGWTILGRLLTSIYGYFPATKLKVGSDNDPSKFYYQNNNWVYTKKWIDPESGFDYRKKLKSIDLPPVYFYTGVNDKLLGNPIDVKKLAEECNSSENVTILGKKNGNLHDYDHINILTHPDAVKDHFPEIAELYKKHSMST